MGLFDDDDFELDELLDSLIKYPPYVSELNGDIVQELFNNCLANVNTKEMATSFLFPTVLGYKQGSEKPIHFDKDSLLKYKKNIEYLFGQLHRVHDPNGTYKMSIDDFNKTYQNLFLLYFLQRIL